jgi:HK97 family phage prohead protease
MPKTFEKISEEVAKKMAETLAGLNLKEFTEKTKAAQDSGTFEVIVSTDNEDRQGEILDQAGLNTEFYLTNPVVLWAHDYHSLPIGITESITKEGNKTIAKGRFAPEEANSFAQQVRKLYDAGIVRTTSVGFIAKEMKGNVITSSELLEFSFVPVPANPYALSMRTLKDLGLDAEMLKMKGLEISEKGEVSDEEKKRIDRQLKWENLDKCDSVIGAFYNVYLDENTTVEKFNDLLAETIQLLSKILPAETTATEEVAKAVAEGKTIDRGQEKRLEKLTQSINGLKAEIAALKKGDEEKPAEGTPQEGSQNAGSDEVVKAIKLIGETKQVLRMVSTAVSDSLQKINREMKS